MQRVPRQAYHEMYHLECTGPTRLKEIGHWETIAPGVGS